jgi:hypothetical protein
MLTSEAGWMPDGSPAATEYTTTSEFPGGAVGVATTVPVAEGCNVFVGEGGVCTAPRVIDTLLTQTLAGRELPAWFTREMQGVNVPEYFTPTGGQDCSDGLATTCNAVSLWRRSVAFGLAGTPVVEKMSKKLLAG